MEPVRLRVTYQYKSFIPFEFRLYWEAAMVTNVLPVLTLDASSWISGLYESIRWVRSP